jgi:single-strand DNA-binding protein
MSSLRNQIQLIGFLGNDPEVVVSPKGVKYAKFNLATSERYKNKEGENVTETTWHRVTVFGTQADIAEKYLTKGKEVCISGKLGNNEYIDKEGQKRTTIEIRVLDILLLGGNSSAAKTDYANATSGNASKENASSKSKNAAIDMDEDLPF